jgi:hypothetical protein
MSDEVKKFENQAAEIGRLLFHLSNLIRIIERQNGFMPHDDQAVLVAARRAAGLL